MPTSPVHWEEPRQPTVPHLRRTALLVNLAAVLERCDEQMLPAVYRFIGATWSATPTQLGYITLCRALVQALSSPLGGIAGKEGKQSQRDVAQWRMGAGFCVGVPPLQARPRGCATWLRPWRAASPPSSSA